MRIYNRWGIKIFEVANYGIDDNFFRGFSSGRVTIKESDKLPSGTYFYVIEYENASGDTKNKAGYLYIN